MIKDEKNIEMIRILLEAISFALVFLYGLTIFNAHSAGSINPYFLFWK